MICYSDSVNDLASEYHHLSLEYYFSSFMRIRYKCTSTYQHRNMKHKISYTFNSFSIICLVACSFRKVLDRHATCLSFPSATTFATVFQEKGNRLKSGNTTMGKESNMSNLKACLRPSTLWHEFRGSEQHATTGVGL